MQKDRPLNRQFTKDELETKKPKQPKIHIDDYKPSGNLYKGLKTKDGRRIDYIQPSDAMNPTDVWRLYCFKGDEEVDHPTVMSTNSFYLIGRDIDNVDVVLQHRTTEKQHAVIQFRTYENLVLPYIIDLGSTDGTYLNKKRIKDGVYVEIRQGDVLMFGKSLREYVVVKENKTKKTKKR
ncbi:FHA domain-containing protein [Entamoeba marina]